MYSYTNFIDNYLDNILAFAGILFAGLFVSAFIFIPYMFFRKSFKKNRQIKYGGKTAEGEVTYTYSRRVHDEYHSRSHWATYRFTAEDRRNYEGTFPQKRKSMHGISDKITIYYNPICPK